MPFLRTSSRNDTRTTIIGRAQSPSEDQKCPKPRPRSKVQLAGLFSSAFVVLTARCSLQLSTAYDSNQAVLFSTATSMNAAFEPGLGKRKMNNGRRICRSPSRDDNYDVHEVGNTKHDRTGWGTFDFWKTLRDSHCISFSKDHGKLRISSSSS